MAGNNDKQESLPVGCIPPVCQLYVFWWPLLGVSTRGVSWDLGYTEDTVLSLGYVYFNHKNYRGIWFA